MKFIVDSDILSTFAKINRLKILLRFSDKIRITLEVKKEIEFLNKYNLEFVENILNFKKLEVIKPNEEEIILKYNLSKILGKGEAEAIAICKHKYYILFSNDKFAKIEAEKLGVEVFNLFDILVALALKKITKKELKKIIEEIEIKDKTKIKFKDKILNL